MIGDEPATGSEMYEFVISNKYLLRCVSCTYVASVAHDAVGWYLVRESDGNTYVDRVQQLPVFLCISAQFDTSPFTGEPLCSCM